MSKKLDELWIPIPGFEQYEISTYGIVRNCKTERILHGNTIGKGLKQVFLYKDTDEGRVRQSFYIHRLVAAAFLRDFNEELTVVHRNQKHIHDNSVLNIKMTDERARKRAA